MHTNINVHLYIARFEQKLFKGYQNQKIRLHRVLFGDITVTEYDEWDHIVRIAMLGLFQDVMRNWRSSATATIYLIL
jgi:hypothetical protein